MEREQEQSEKPVFLLQDKDNTCVFRDPIHGLITVYPWELALIDSDEFHRLRRIHQLSMTYLIYHGAEHTRFGHSIGVMHLAGQIMDHLRAFSPLKELDDDSFFEKKMLVRMAGLLHDIGHGCFSHVGEQEANIYPNLIDPVSGEMVSGHEAYTRCIIKEKLSGIIEKYWPKEKYQMVEDILLILSQGTTDSKFRFFDDIISGQLDCDKMDYLLRDSYYCGVEYGVYDLDKLIHSLRVATIEGQNLLAIGQSGIQAVEGFILARYWMFIQVYFHKDRRLFDYYLSSFMKEYLLQFEFKNGQYPSNIDSYLAMDDSKIETIIGEYAKKEPDAETTRICYFARKLYTREHHKVVFDPPYVHYKEKDEEQKESYKRLGYVGRKVQDFWKAHITEETQFNVYIDLAKSSATKHMFEIKVYNEEQDPDFQHLESYSKLVPAIPVISKHDDQIHPIQDYSFALRSISDRKISILRIYAEDPAIATELQEKCTDWFTHEYTKKRNELLEKRKKQAELVQEKNTIDSEIAALSEALGIE